MANDYRLMTKVLDFGFKTKKTQKSNSEFFLLR